VWRLPFMSSSASPLRNEFHRLGRGGHGHRAHRQSVRTKGDAVLIRDCLDGPSRPHEERRNEPGGGSLDGARESGGLARCATAVGIGSRPRHRSRSCSYFPVPVSRFMTPCSQGNGTRRRADGPSPSERGENNGQRHTEQQRRERGLVVRARLCSAPPLTASESTRTPARGAR
jgi:hypothetical protein